jgi:lipopolysaccharide transport system ATP-binding protein
MQPAIRIENLGKSYRVNHAVESGGYRTLRESLTDLAAAPLRRLRNPGHDGSVEEFWALKDVSFDIMPGEVVGIIGRNGAGKSTLLKILSRVTKPTKGSVTINGRVGSLLEVGTGFHPELTGRENIYMNGSILGMSRREISRNFDEIVDFAEVERFIDTPVKRYSSGMQVRLAFAVAAHLQPEILIVDEVLAVGDMGFQTKCLGKMSEVASDGRTVAFVSHNMAAVANLCKRGVLLDGGQIKTDSTPETAIEQYNQSFLRAQSTNLREIKRPQQFKPVIARVQFNKAATEESSTIFTGDSLTIDIEYEHLVPLRDAYFGLTFQSSQGVNVLWCQSRLQQGDFPILPSRGSIRCHLPSLPLVPGCYSIAVGCGTGSMQLDYVERACHLDIAPTDFFGTGRLPNPRQSLILLPATWTS